MTISTTTTTVTISGNGITTMFNFPFVGAAASDISVTYTNNLGIPVVLSPTLYTLVFNPIPSGGLWSVGGTVEYPLVGSPILVGTSLSITRTVPYTQNVSIGDQSNFYPQAVEQGLDLLEMQLQQSQTSTEYALQTPVSDGTPPNILPSAAARANGYLAFDSNGEPIVTSGTGAVEAPSEAQPRKVSTTGTATIPILVTDSFSGVSIYQSSTPVTTVQLPANGGPYPLFDGSGNAGSNNITVLPPAGKLISGQSSYLLNSAFQSVTFYWDGTQYVVGAGSQGLGNNISVSGSIAAGTTVTAGTTMTAGTTVTAGTGVTATTGNVTATVGFVIDKSGDLRAIPPNAQHASYVLQTADSGHFVHMDTSGAGQTVTLNTGVFFTAEVVVILNRTGFNLTIVQGSGTSIVLAGNGATGNRTLANTGIATLLFYGNNNCVISGSGLT